MLSIILRLAVMMVTLTVAERTFRNHFPIKGSFKENGEITVRFRITRHTIIDERVLFHLRPLLHPADFYRIKMTADKRRNMKITTRVIKDTRQFLTDISPLLPKDVYKKLMNFHLQAVR